MMCSKAALRARMRAFHEALTPAEAGACDAGILAHIHAWPVYRMAHTVMLYMPLPGEPDISPLLEEGLAAGKRMLLPRCGSNGTLDAVAVRERSALQRGTYGIVEPIGTLPAEPPACIDLLLIPGLAFDLRGYRLGRGKGYYDMFLCRTPAITAGIAQAGRMLPALPCEAHDRAVQYLINEEGILRMPHEGGLPL